MTHNSPMSRPRELDATLTSRADGDALATVWDALSTPSVRTPAPTDAERGAAWARLRATLTDPARQPYTTDVQAPLALVDDDDDAVPADDVRAPLPTVSPRSSVAAVTRTNRVPRWLAAACLVAVPALGVAGVRAVPVRYDAPAATGAVAVAPRMVRLEDGSTVWLAPGSSLSVPRALGWPGVLRSASRTVALTGRGFFTVARDGRTFTVRTRDAQVRVLGTRFDVRGPAGTWGTQVMVEEGHVAVSAAARAEAGGTVELRAGQRAVVGGGGTTPLVTAVSPERIASWRSGGLAALDEPLGAVLDELAHRAGVEITRAGDIDEVAAVSLFYPSMPAINVVLADLCTAQGLRFERTSRGYHLTRSTSRP
jgi:transmembrane sensor